MESVLTFNDDNFYSVATSVNMLPMCSSALSTSGRKTRDSLVFRPLVKGNEDSGNEIGLNEEKKKQKESRNFNPGLTAWVIISK